MNNPNAVNEAIIANLAKREGTTVKRLAPGATLVTLQCRKPEDTPPQNDETPAGAGEGKG